MTSLSPCKHTSPVAAKRQALHQGGLLEYVETPVDLGEIGGCVG